MAEFPALPLWTDAYLGDTAHLTTIEHGAYLLLLMAMWRTAEKSLPSDDKMLARYARLNAGQWARMRPIIMPFFREKDGRISQGRLTDEASAVKRNSRRQSNKAKARWLKEKETGHAAAMPEPCPTDASLTLTQSHVAEEAEASPAMARKRAARHTPIPPDAVLSEAGWAKAEAKGLSRAEAEAQFIRCRDHAIAAGRTYADWSRAWTNGLGSSYFRPLTAPTVVALKPEAANVRQPSRLDAFLSGARSVG
jgi:uncharacterized protein YdaU (DUF1376 family)